MDMYSIKYFYSRIFIGGGTPKMTFLCHNLRRAIFMSLNDIFMSVTLYCHTMTLSCHDMIMV